MNYPKWSDIAGLVGRLKKRKHPDCIAAATKLEDLHSCLHNTTAALESSQVRATSLGVLLEEVAGAAEGLGDGDNPHKFMTVPSGAWFRLLAFYRSQQEGHDMHRELKALRELAGITGETLRAVDNWLGNCGTRQAAMDSLWRLQRILERAGFPMPLEHLA